MSLMDIFPNGVSSRVAACTLALSTVFLEGCVTNPARTIEQVIRHDTNAARKAGAREGAHAVKCMLGTISNCPE